jgi:UDP:flavonoid glycosyltransferase YjiC (YdhE family)
MLLAGKPLVLVPQVLEQQQTARAVARLGAGWVAAAREPYSIAATLGAALEDGRRHAEAAGRFAARYAAFDGARQRRAIFERANALIAGTEAAEREAPVMAGA